MSAVGEKKHCLCCRFSCLLQFYSVKVHLGWGCPLGVKPIPNVCESGIFTIF